MKLGHQRKGHKGLFIYYVSMNNQWSLFKMMTKDDGEGLMVIRKDDVSKNASLGYRTTG